MFLREICIGLENIATLLFTILEKKIIFSDEAHFDLDGYVNEYVYIEKPTHLKRVTVWSGVIIGLFFFEN